MTIHRGDAAALLLRLTSGWFILAHGLLKLLVFSLPGTAKYFGSIGLPPALAYAVVCFELIGGALLLAGLFYRAASIALIPILLGAAYVHAPNGWLFSAPNGGWEFPVFWALVLTAQALLGPGLFALDALFTRFYGDAAARASV